MKLTIGMAHFEDYSGVFFTIESLLLYHNLEDCEILVVDNSPNSKDGKAVKELCYRLRHKNVRYISMFGECGTAQPRERIFKEANGDYVLCIDCHVLIVPGAIDKLISYYKENPDTSNLLTGPLLSDGLSSVSTNYKDEWRLKSWGTWELDVRGKDVDSPSFDIFAHGLGLFSCKKDKWVGFNKYFRGFGGCEVYIHQKFKKRGNNTICLPFLRWVHKFNVTGVKYRLRMWDTIRNYIIGLKELNISLDRCYKHFIENKYITEENWKYLSQDPINRINPPAECNSCENKNNNNMGVNELFLWYLNNPRDFHEHMQKIKSLVLEHKHITSFINKRECNISILAGLSDKSTYFAYNIEKTNIEDNFKIKNPNINVIMKDIVLNKKIDSTEILFINADRELLEIEKWAKFVQKRIVIFGTQPYGGFEKDNDKDGQPLFRLREFLWNNREWSVIYHSIEQGGLTVISKDKKDKAEKPGVIELALNFSRAMKEYIEDGLQNINKEEYKERLLKCTMCKQRDDDRCAVCGCFLELKAKIRSSQCPLNQW